jgi:hypothetical protein
MATKFSDFSTAASLSGTGFIVGYDGASNFKMTKSALESSLDLANISGSIDLATQTTGDIDLTTQVTGALPILNGGTGQTTAALAIDALTNSVAQTTNNIPYYNAGVFSSINPSSHPNIPTVAMVSATWLGVTNPYFNIPGTWTIIPFDTIQYTRTTHPNNNLIPTIQLLGPVDTFIDFHPESFGRLYRIDVTMHMYDQYGNFDFKTAIFNRAGIPSIIESVIDERSAESSNDKMFYGYTLYSPVDAATSRIDVRALSQTNAYPSNVDKGFIRVTVSLVE